MTVLHNVDMLSIRLISLYQPLFHRAQFTLKSEDLVIKNTLGGGPGGAKVASQKNCAFVKHVPTGLFVKCHDTRSLERNISIAIKKLTDKVELELYGDQSSVAIKEARRIQKKKEYSQHSSEKMKQRIEANSVKRLAIEDQRQKQLEKVLKMGLPYLSSHVPDNDDLSDQPDASVTEEHVLNQEDLYEGSHQIDTQELVQERCQKSPNSVFGNSKNMNGK